MCQDGTWLCPRLRGGSLARISFCRSAVIRWSAVFVFSVHPNKGAHMSTKDNVARIGKIYEAFGRGDVGYIIAQLTDDVRWVTHCEPLVPWAGDFSGKANVPRFFEAIGSSVEVTAFNPGEFIAEGDAVVSTGEFGCRVRATGKSTLTRWAFIWKLRDGRVCGYEQFHDPALADGFRS
jgi:ketosteroid isomerase-like protein